MKCLIHFSISQFYIHSQAARHIKMSRQRHVNDLPNVCTLMEQTSFIIDFFFSLYIFLNAANSMQLGRYWTMSFTPKR